MNSGGSCADVVVDQSAPVPVGVTFVTAVNVSGGDRLAFTVTDAVAGDLVTVRVVADADRLDLVNGNAVKVYAEVDGVQSAEEQTEAMEAGTYDVLTTCDANGSTCAPVIDVQTCGGGALMAAYKRKYRENGEAKVDGQWRYRKWVTLADGSRVRISGRPAMNTKQAALDAEAAHVDRVLHP